jgi:hypothetical protein
MKEAEDIPRTKVKHDVGGGGMLNQFFNIKLRDNKITIE